MTNEVNQSINEVNKVTVINLKTCTFPVIFFYLNKYVFFFINQFNP